jgi:hypothetical protein
MATPKEAVETFSRRIREEYETWYERHEAICRWWYLGLQLVVFLVSVTTAIIAALTDAAAFTAWAKYALVALPIVSSVAMTLVTQVRLYDLWKLREEGRIQCQDLAIEGERLAAAATTDAECTKVHGDLQKRLNEIESTQSASFFGLFRADLIVELKRK